MDEFNRGLDNEQVNSDVMGETTDIQENAESVAQETFETEPETVIDEPQTEPQPEQPAPPVEPVITPTWNPVSYTPVEPVKDYKPASKGLKVFSGIMALVILLTAATATGYFLGKNSNSVTGIGSKVEVELDSIPRDEDKYNASSVYTMVDESVVGINVYNSSGLASGASGVVYSEDGYIVTNDHIYSEIGAAKFRIYMSDGKEYDAVYVAGDSISDLAVLKITDKVKLKPAKFGDSSELICGDDVVAIGRPSDATAKSSITSGIVSLPRRRVKTTSNYTSSLIQTDSAINPGSSGGALVNMYGQVVGITSSKLAGVEYDSVGYAIPSVMVKRVVEQLIEEGKVVDRAKLGITYTEYSSLYAIIGGTDYVGLYIASVSKECDLHGIAGEGDIITHINGIEITNDDVVLDIIEESKAGDTITLTIVGKNGIPTDYSVELKVNIGESSYSTVENKPETESQPSQGGTFDFPDGE